MGQAIQAVYENGMFRPLEKLGLSEHQQVQLIIETGAAVDPSRKSGHDDPLDGVGCATGIPDLAEHFDDYRLGCRNP